MDIAIKCQTNNAERLIDANALKARWYSINDIDETDRGARFMGYTEIARLIDHAPTIDAVEVVRCKDCKHRYIFATNETGTVTHYYVCDFMEAQYEDEGYCHHGERSEE